jgi:protease-4
VLLVLPASIALNLLLLGWAALSAGEGDYRIQEKFVSHNRQAPDKVAIISLEGIILDTGDREDSFVKRQIDRVIADKHVKAVVLRVNSPGGSVSGSDYIYHHLCRMTQQRNIPLVVSMGGLAASGGYYVSMAVGHQPDSIFAEPTTFTGSIGVIMPRYDLTELMVKIGAQEDFIVSAPLKGMGSLTRPMTEQERKIFQDLVNDSFARFKQIVRNGREKFDKDPAALDKLATGQVYAADQAKHDGLIDRIAFLEDAVDRAIELAHLDKEDVQVVRYKPEASLRAMLTGSQSQVHTMAELQALQELSSPQAYYLYTWLPVLPHGQRP